VDCIASWDGYSWLPLGDGIGGMPENSVDALVVFNDLLIAGGEFATAGNNASKCLAQWDGEQWHSMGSGFYSSANYPGRVYPDPAPLDITQDEGVLRR
jgi:hypothetical protein